MSQAQLNCTECIDLIKQDLRYQTGIEYLQNKQYEEAVQMFSDFLETKQQEQTGDHDLPLGPLYYQYGNALLFTVETNASNVFGSEIEDKKVEPKSETAPPAQGEEEETEDIQLAWEMLEVARVIYSKYLDAFIASSSESSASDHSVVSQDRTTLSSELIRVHTRLGDLGQESGQFEQAKEDYHRSLKLLLQAKSNDMDATERLKNQKSIADMHSCLAMACVYQSYNLKHDAHDSLEQALLEDSYQHYVSAGKVFHDILTGQFQALVPVPCAELKTLIEETLRCTSLPAASPPAAKKKGKGKAATKDQLLLAQSTSELIFETQDLERFKSAYLNLIPSTDDIASSVYADFLENTEIYAELKERADGLLVAIRENLKKQQRMATPLEGVTQIGFGHATTGGASSSSSSVAKPAVVEHENKENEASAPASNLNLLVRKKKRTTSAPAVGTLDKDVASSADGEEEQEAEERPAKVMKVAPVATSDISHQ